MSVEESLGRGGVDGGHGGDHWDRGDHGVSLVGDGDRGRGVVDDRAQGGVSVSLDGAVGEVSSDAFGVHHSAVQAGSAHQRGGGRGVHGRLHVGRGCRVSGDQSGFGGGQGDGGEQQSYHDDLQHERRD